MSNFHNNAYTSKNAKGFTLIELMIAISILSLLLFTGSYSYSLMSARWNKELGHFAQLASQAKNQQLLQSLLAGVQTFVITDKKQRPAFFFIGKQQSLLAVSRGGIYSDKYPEIFRLSTVENDNGLFDLVYQSRSTKNLLLVATEQEITFTQQLTLFTDLTSVSFAYLGWSHFNEKTTNGEIIKPPQWFDNFSGIDNQLMPTNMTITLTNTQGNFILPVELDKESELRLSTFAEDDQ
jgi:prepilin-type N-terminal cleavage/methylation domain-containing protein